MSDKTLSQWIREVLADYPQNSDETVAIEVLNRLRVPVKAARVLVPVVASCVQGLARDDARKVEHRAHRLHALGSTRNEIPGMEPIDVVSMRRQALKELYETPLPELPNVLWGDATIEQLDEADLRLGKKERGIARTRALIAQARADLIASGGACLRDIQDEAA